jgi:hypothetical protein
MHQFIMVTYVCLAFTLTVQEIGKLCEDKELKLEYLPPYSPDLNPIEYSFSVIKKAIQKDRMIEECEDVMKFAEKVLKIANEKVTPEIARNQFRHCNISLV